MLTANDLMTIDPDTVTPHASLREVVALMNNNVDGICRQQIPTVFLTRGDDVTRGGLKLFSEMVQQERNDGSNIQRLNKKIGIKLKKNACGCPHAFKSKNYA